MEWEEKRTLIQVERNLEMQEMREKKNKHTKNNHVCMNVISSLKSRQADDSG